MSLRESSQLTLARLAKEQKPESKPTKKTREAKERNRNVVWNERDNESGSCLYSRIAIAHQAKTENEEQSHNVV
jgi:hypothetical protein